MHRLVGNYPELTSDREEEEEDGGDNNDDDDDDEDDDADMKSVLK